MTLLEKTELNRIAQNCAELRAQNHAIARVSLFKTRGSTPREQGAYMLVSPYATAGTIGGGALEFLAIDLARKHLTSCNNNEIYFDQALGPEIGQCCGGFVTLKVENCSPKLLDEIVLDEQKRAQSQPNIFIFGAGHIGNALAHSFSLLPFNFMVLDTRAAEIAQLPNHVKAKHLPVPEAFVRTAPSGSAFLILTHDHGLDFLIAYEALARRDAAYVGLIGSQTKRATFSSWLKNNHNSQSLINNLTCPIGSDIVNDKRPAIIAALVTAQIITAFSTFKGAE